MKAQPGTREDRRIPYSGGGLSVMPPTPSNRGPRSLVGGPAHAAAALGLPLVVMYGAESQQYWLPRSHSGSPVVGVGGPPESVRVDQIPVDRVFDAWCAVLARIEAGPRRATRCRDW